jgi:hypothetical protein
MICKPLHLLDCCVETDNANCIIVTSADRARDCKHHPVLIRSVVGRCSKPRTDMHYQHGPISTVAGHYAKDILFPNADVSPQDIDVTGSYDAFTFTTMLQLEDYGFCKKGEGPQYVSDGTMRLGGRRPNKPPAAPVRRLHARHRDGDRKRAAAAPRRGRQRPIGRTAKRQHTRLPGRRLPAGEGCAAVGQSGLGHAGTGSAMIMRRG